ncbi:MAG: MARVEL domain-containing protein [Verrucomicrobiota bacterium]
MSKSSKPKRRKQAKRAAQKHPAKQPCRASFSNGVEGLLQPLGESVQTTNDEQTRQNAKENRVPANRVGVIVVEIISAFVFAGFAQMYFSTGHPIVGIWFTFGIAVAAAFLIAYHASKSYPSRARIAWALSGCVSFFLLIAFSAWSYRLHSSRSDSQLLEGVSEGVKDLQARMRKYSDENYKALAKKYPLGYALFWVDHRSVVSTYDKLGSGNYEFDWATSKIIAIEPDKVELLAPEVTNRVSHFHLHSTVLALHKNPPIWFAASIATEDFGLKGEILEQDQDSVVAVLGVVEVKVPTQRIK